MRETFKNYAGCNQGYRKLLFSSWEQSRRNGIVRCLKDMQSYGPLNGRKDVQD